MTFCDETRDEAIARCGAAAKRCTTRWLRATAMLTLALVTVEGSATTLQDIPGLQMNHPDGSTVAILKLFPVAGGDLPTHWLVTTSDGQTTAFSLSELPTLHEGNHMLHLRDLQVDRLQSARCSIATDQPIGGSRNASKCVPVDVAILLGAPDEQEGEAPRLIPVTTTSEVGVAIAPYVLKGGTVRMSPTLDVPKRCLPKPPYRAEERWSCRNAEDF